MPNQDKAAEPREVELFGDVNRILFSHVPLQFNAHHWRTFRSQHSVLIMIG